MRIEAGPGPPRGELALQHQAPPRRPDPTFQLPTPPDPHSRATKKLFTNFSGWAQAARSSLPASPHTIPHGSGPHREGEVDWPLGRRGLGLGAEACGVHDALPSCPGVLYSEQSKISALEGSVLQWRHVQWQSNKKHAGHGEGGAQKVTWMQ